MDEHFKKATDEGIVSDWKFFIDYKEETDWAYKWDYAESSTAKPTSAEGRATLFLSFFAVATDDPMEDFRRYIDSVNKDKHGSEKINYTVSKDNSKDNNGESNRKCITITTSKNARLRGYLCGKLKGYDKFGGMYDANVGNYAVFTNTNVAGYELMIYLKATTNHGYAAFIDHSSLSIPILDGIQMHVVTGCGPRLCDKGKETNEFHPDSLATRFTISEIETKKDIARCLLSYRDGSYDPSVGPTMEMIEVYQDYRGQGYLPLLWAYVKKFIQDNFTLECMNVVVEPGYIMIKAQQLTNSIIDKRINKKGRLINITDKDFFYQYVGFSIREQKSMMSFLFASRRPEDEDAVLYIPLLCHEKHNNCLSILHIPLLSKDIQYESYSSISLPDPGQHMKWKRKLGSVSCHACRKVDVKHFLCKGCELVHYCSRQCQKYDWKRRHKIWCGRTRDEVIPILIEKGYLFKTKDGSLVELPCCPRTIDAFEEKTHRCFPGE